MAMRETHKYNPSQNGSFSNSSPNFVSINHSVWRARIGQCSSRLCQRRMQSFYCWRIPMWTMRMTLNSWCWNDSYWWLLPVSWHSQEKAPAGLSACHRRWSSQWLVWQVQLPLFIDNINLRKIIVIGSLIHKNVKLVTWHVNIGGIGEVVKRFRKILKSHSM